jgi:hypothetical protein
MQSQIILQVSVPARATRRNIPEDSILHSHAVKTSTLTELSVALKREVTFDVRTLNTWYKNQENRLSSI